MLINLSSYGHFPLLIIIIDGTYRYYIFRLSPHMKIKQGKDSLSLTLCRDGLGTSDRISLIQLLTMIPAPPACRSYRCRMRNDLCLPNFQGQASSSN